MPPKTEAPATRAVQNPDPLLSVEQAADYLNSTPRFLRRMREQKRLVGTKLGGKNGTVRYRQSALDKFINECEEHSNPGGQ